MSNFTEDIARIWDRLFDHRAYLAGETAFFLREFEEKRHDKEIDNLFETIENIIEVKDNEINKLKDSVAESVTEVNQQLGTALRLTNNIFELEINYNNKDSLQADRNRRKHELDKLVDEIAVEYSRVNGEFEETEKELRKFYSELEKKLI